MKSIKLQSHRVIFSKSHYVFCCFYLLLIVLISFPLKSVADTTKNNINKEKGWHKLSIQHEEQQRYFRYYISSNLKENPEVVLLFHGGTQSMRKIFRKRAGGSQEWQTLAEQYGFLLLVPNGTNVKNGDTKGNKQNWNDCRIAIEGNNSSSKADDVGFINQLIDWSKNHFDSNANRVYVTGASNGGLMSLRLITELKNKIAAAAVFIANQPVKTDCDNKFSRPVPLLLMLATEDPLMQWQGGQIRGNGPVMMSAMETLDYWLQRNRLDKNKVKTEQLPDIDTSDKSIIIKNVYSEVLPSQTNAQPLWFYEVRGAGHTTPSIKYDVPFLAKALVGKQNKDLEAAQEAWSFLRQFSLGK